MEFKNALIALMLLLSSTHTHKPMADEVSLDSFLSDDSNLPSFTGEESMFTGPLAPGYMEYYNALTNYNVLVPTAQLEHLDSANVILNADSVSIGRHVALKTPSALPAKKRKRNNDAACDYCGKIINSFLDLQRHVSIHLRVDMCCPVDKCHRKLPDASIYSIEVHLGLIHKKDCKELGKSVSQFAREIYKAALDAR